MPRGKKRRCCRVLEDEIIFKPAGIPMSELEIIEMELDELEAVRLSDYENKSQIEAGEIMNVSRGTIQRLLTSGRKKILDGLLHSKAIKLKNTYSNYNGEKIIKMVTGWGSLLAIIAIFPRIPFLFKFVSDIISLLLFILLLV